MTQNLQKHEKIKNSWAIAQHYAACIGKKAQCWFSATEQQGKRVAEKSDFITELSINISLIVTVQLTRHIWLTSRFFMQNRSK